MYMTVTGFSVDGKLDPKKWPIPLPDKPFFENAVYSSSNSLSVY